MKKCKTYSFKPAFLYVVDHIRITGITVKQILFIVKRICFLRAKISHVFVLFIYFLIHRSSSSLPGPLKLQHQSKNIPVPLYVKVFYMYLCSMIYTM